MAKLFLTTILLVAFAGIEAQQQQLRQATGNYGQDAMNSAANYAQNLPSQMQNQLGQGMDSLRNQGQGLFGGQGQGQQGGLFGGLSGLLGGSGGSGGNSGNSGPFETLRQLPARGLQMLNNVFSGVRDMLPLGLGRNANNNNNNGYNKNNNNSQSQGNGQNNPLGQLSPDQLLQNLPKNPITDMAQGLLGGQNGAQNSYGNGQQSSNGLRLPNLNQITNPVMQPLQQGRLPDVNELSRGAQNTVRDLTSGLMSLPSNLGATTQGSSGSSSSSSGSGTQGGLGGMLSNLGQTTASV